MVDVAMSILMLINAIYFKGNWTASSTRPKRRTASSRRLNGKRKKHPMMSQSGSYKYCRDKGFQAVSLPYGNEKVSMYIFLPHQDSSLDEFQRV